MANLIKKIKTKKGTPAWRIDGRKFNAVPVRPQLKTKAKAEARLVTAPAGARQPHTRRRY